MLLPYPDLRQRGGPYVPGKGKEKVDPRKVQLEIHIPKVMFIIAASRVEVSHDLDGNHLLRMICRGLRHKEGGEDYSMSP